MNSDNPETESVVGDESIVIESDRDEVRVIRSRLREIATLTISEDSDRGGDPYNSTGQHVVIRNYPAED